MRIELPVANGIRTDHPEPGLPFVDDSHLPIHDGQAIESHGRHDYNPGWGRYDQDRDDERRWNAFTNDQFNLTFSWLVRNDPDHGRTVLLYANGDETIMHKVTPREGDPLLHRAGGYWWDGTTWHRPAITYDRSTEKALPSPVPDAAAITAHDYLLTNPGTPEKGTRADITTFKPGPVGQAQWRHDLASWAACRPEDALPLEKCIVDVSAAELDRAALVSTAGAARVTGLSRKEVHEAITGAAGGRATRFPFPQRHTAHTGSPRWSKPVLQEWAWERQRAHPEPVVTHLHSGRASPDAEALLYTIESAALWQMQATYTPRPEQCSLGLPLERMIGWIVTDRPDLAEAVFGDIFHSARQELHLSDETITQALRDAVHWGTPGDDDGALEEFLRRVLPPTVTE